MSIHHQADKTPTPRYKPYKGPAGGWGALISVAQAWLTSDNALKNLRMMLKTNQNGGFDCPGCAWGDSPESGLVKFCENGAKAVNWEATKRRVDAAFFAKHSVSALLEQSDYWLEYQGRLTEPMSYDPETDRYTPISWDAAFALIARHLLNLASPNEAEFYTSGRASNEAAYLYQLFVRAFGTNNFPDCSNMCHEASGVALAQSIGVGKGTVTFDDFEHADAIFVLGQNPGTNHPRMLEPLREAVKRGAQVVCVNPLKERGLERFQHPQHPLEMLTNGDRPTNTAYLRPALGGDMALLRGNIGRPGAGLCPVRGHSNVQGDRTMGINERPPVAFLDSLERRFQFKVPRDNGHNVVEAIHAMLEGRAKVFIGLGGNFAQATPDSPRTAQALRNCELTVQISTKLNRSHLMHGKEALILPCLGRTDIDIQAEGPQAVTVEDSFSMVHASNGQLQPLSNQMRSEPAIIAGIAAATLGAHPIDWNWVVADYRRIRDLIADTIPGFKDFNTRIEHPGGFYLGNSAGARVWNTPSGRANFRPNVLPQDLVDARTRATGKLPDLILQSMRSHDQYNTTIYGLDDRYRGVKGQRDVLFVNEADIIRLGFKPGQKVDIVSIWDDQHERRVKNFTLLAFDIPAGQAAAYYPEVNPLVPLESTGDGSHTPTSKFVAICLDAARPSRLIMAKASSAATGFSNYFFQAQKRLLWLKAACLNER